MFIQQILNGLAIGSIYSLIGLGFSLLFGAMGILNLAYGEFYMLATYLAFFSFTKFRFPFPIMILIVVIFLFFIGCATHLGLVKPIKSRTKDWVIPALIVTLGLQIVFQESIRLIWGASFKSIPGYFLESIHIGSLMISYERAIILVVSVFLLAGTWFFLNRTKLGSGILAVAQDRESAELVGIDTEKINTITFGISSALAGIAGVLLMPILCVYPTVGQEPLLRAFAVAILGGMGSVGGAMISGVILGIAESLAVGYISASIKDLMSFAVIIIVLIFYPSGVAGFMERLRAK
jgi:branched-chain amino acid transport system permease protein